MDFAEQIERRPEKPFVPELPLRNGVLQTVLTTVRWDVPKSLNDWGQPILVEAGTDETGRGREPVRLVAYYTPRRDECPDRGVVILLHGWEGCSHSTYNLVTARELANAGYHVFRLNLRDHGPGLYVHPQALNPGVFLGTLLSESLHAMAQCAVQFEHLPAYIVGFSMGGNFALRAAINYSASLIPNLRRVIAINPAINPSWSTDRIDRYLPLRRHFREPWVHQLREKQRLFPHLYDFEPATRIPSLVDMTTWLVRYLGLYESAEEYFAGYAVLGNATKGIEVSTHIITTLDDLIVPVADFYGLAPNPNLKIEIHAHGGHMGYLQGIPPLHKVGKIVRAAIESC